VVRAPQDNASALAGDRGAVAHGFALMLPILLGNLFHLNAACSPAASG
jgi:hypothetical protein